MDIREIIIQPIATQQAHIRSPKKRLTVNELCGIYKINETLLQP